MTASTICHCPHCTYAYQAGDPRFAVPKGKTSRVMACPACGGAIRVWAPGASPSERRSLWPYVIVAIVVAAAYLYFRS